ncbi:MAG: hypothetical protein AB1404_07000 [Spirochaetota bacterium]
MSATSKRERPGMGLQEAGPWKATPFSRLKLLRLSMKWTAFLIYMDYRLFI